MNVKIVIEALRPDQIIEISEIVGRILWEQGIIVNETDVCSFFSGKGAKVSGSTVHIPKEMLNQALDSVPKQYTLHSRNPEKCVTVGLGFPVLINPNSGMSFIQDVDGSRRPGSMEDLVKLLKLNHTSKVTGITNAGLLYPSVGIDPGDAKYLQMIYALTYSDKPFFSQGIDESYGKAAIELAQIATGYRDRPVCMSVVNSLSPMAWDSKMLGMIRLFAQENQPLNISSSSMIGATSPLCLTSAVITAFAEGLFGVVYSQLVRPGAPVVLGAFPGVMDMRFMRMSYGAPEFSMLCAAGAQMASHYKIPYRGGGALTSAQVTGAQSGMESTFGMMFALNSDVHYMHQSIGTLDSILAASMEKFVMDEEIVARIMHIKRGMGEVEDDFTEVLQEGVADRSFLALESTVRNFRETIFTPEFCNNCTYDVWMEKKTSNEELAHKAVEKRLAEYVEPDIGTDIKEQMKRYALKEGAKFV